MATKIEKKITAYEIVSNEDKKKRMPTKHVEPLLERDEILSGYTYKIKTPLSEHALYITINDIVVNQGYDNEHRQPFEIFIVSKNMEHFAWIVALTRVISAVFRKGGDVTFLVEELKGVFDPRGGYYKKGGKYMPSLVAEIGEVIAQHLITIGMMEGQLGNAELENKRQSIKEKMGNKALNNAEICPKCSAKAFVRMDNCATCLECGYSKCG